MSEIQTYLHQKIQVLTTDGRLLLGTLEGFDQTTNLILSNASERVFSSHAGVESIELGLYLVRGDGVCVIGAVDVEKDEGIDWQSVSAPALQPCHMQAF